MNKFNINMDKTHKTYILGLFFLVALIVTFKINPGLALSSMVEIPLRLEFSMIAIAVGGISGGLALTRHSTRTKAPWSMPLAAVSIPYIAFFISSLIAIVLAS